jgi:putative transposase
MGEKLLEGLCENHVLADEAYDSDSIRESVKQMWAKACIKPKGNRKARKRCVKERYRHRNIIKRFFGALKRFRRIATRYEKKVINFGGFLWVASLLTKPF